MVFDGNYSFFVNGESKTKEEVKDLLHSNMTVTVNGLVVNFISPKKDPCYSVDEGYGMFRKCDGSNITGYTTVSHLAKLAENIKNSAKKDGTEKDFKWTTVTVKTSPEDRVKIEKIRQLLKEVNKHQEQNGGRVVGVEFPFDAVLTPVYSESGNRLYFDKDCNLIGEEKDMTAFMNSDFEREVREQQIIEDWNKIDLEGLIQEESLRSWANIGKQIKEESLDLCAKKIETEGIKEKNGKLHYELSWEFIEEMAKRMANNKSDKYPLYNWKKPIDVEDLKDAINRHHIEVMKGNYKDGEEVLGHIVSYACNSMMLWEQLNKK